MILARNGSLNTGYERKQGVYARDFTAYAPKPFCYAQESDPMCGNPLFMRQQDSVSVVPRQQQGQ